MINFLLMLQVVSFFVVCLFGGFLYWGLRRKPPCRSSRNPSVSVLVAARNEADNLPKLVESLSSQDYPPEKIEFIIVDDGSTDGTGSLVAEWAKKDARFQLLHLDDDPHRALGPKKRALTEGIRAASGEIILTTDADCVVPAGWVSGITACFSDDVGAVAGTVKMMPAPGFWSRLAAFENAANVVLNAAVIGAGSALSCIGANFAFRRDAFEGVGGYDTGGNSLSGDDDLLLQKLHAWGYRLRWSCDPKTVVRTAAPRCAAEYWSRKRRHLSAGRRYATHWIALAVSVFLGSFSTAVLTVFALAGLSFNILFLTVWGVFSAGLWLLFQRGVRLIGEEGWTLYSALAALLFPIVFTVIHPLTLLPSPTWKGRGVVQ